MERLLEILVRSVGFHMFDDVIQENVDFTLLDNQWKRRTHHIKKMRITKKKMARRSGRPQIFEGINHAHTSHLLIMGQTAQLQEEQAVLSLINFCGKKKKKKGELRVCVNFMHNKQKREGKRTNERKRPTEKCFSRYSTKTSAIPQYSDGS